MDVKIKVYFEDLSNGKNVAIDFPAELETVKQKMNNHDFAIAFFTSNIELGDSFNEYTHVDDINRFIDACYDYDQETIEALTSNIADIDELNSVLEEGDFVYFPCGSHDDEDLGYYLVEEGGYNLEDMDRDDLEEYFNYDMFGRHKRVEWNLVETENGYIAIH